MSTAKLTTKGQITIPKEVRDHLGVETGDRLSFEIRDGGEVLVQAETIDIRSLRAIVDRKRARVSVREMDEAIRKGASGR